MSARGVDFHCHIDLFPDPSAIIAACESEGVIMLAVTTTPKAWPQNRRWTAGSAYVHAAVGLHPELVGERQGEIGLLEDCIGECHLVGEIGLDGSPQHRKSWQAQGEVFTRAIARAQRLGERVLSIHSRRAADEVVRLLTEHTTPDRVLPVLHWFSGSASAARMAVRRGCYFSINPRMLGHDAGIGLVRSLPHDRLLTETDAPLAVQGSKRLAPTEALLVAAKLARTLGVEAVEMQEILLSNVARLFKFTGLEIK